MKTFVQNRKYAYLATGLTVLCSILIFTFAGELFGGEKIFIRGDMISQYIPYTKAFWAAVLGKESIDYSFGLGLGMPTVPIYTMYSLCPINMLYIFIQDVNVASVFVVFCKYALSAYFMVRFLEYFLQKKKLSNVYFALGYALCGYSIAFYYNILYADGVYMVPLLLLLLMKFVESGKVWKVTLAYGWLFLCSFYAGYMVGFFTLFCFIFLLFYKKTEIARKLLIIKFILGVVIAALLCGAFLFPTAQYIFSHMADDVSVLQEIFRNPLELLANLFVGQYQSMLAPIPLVYTGLLSMLILPLFFMQKKMEKKYKIAAGTLLGFLVLCCLWKPLFSFMHLFDVPDYYYFRFSYLISFVLATMGALYVEKAKEKKKNVLIVLVAFVALYITVMFLQMNSLAETEKSMSYLGLLINVLFLGGYGFFFILSKKKEKRTWKIVVSLLVMGELILNGVLTVKRIESAEAYGRDFYAYDKEELATSLAQITEEERENYRVWIVNAMGNNVAMREGVMENCYFCTIENPSMRQFMQKNGYATSNRLVSDYGGTDFTRMLLGQKYTVDIHYPDTIYDHGKESEVRVGNALPLAFMCTEDMITLTLSDTDPFENLNRIACAITGVEEAIYVPYEGETEVVTTGVDYTWDGQQYTFNVQTNYQNGEVAFKTTTEEKLFAYIQPGINQKYTYSPRVYTNDDFGCLQSASMLYTPSIKYLTENEEGEKNIYIALNGNTDRSGFFNDVYFYVEREEILEQVYQKAKPYGAENFVREGDSISFDITADAGHSLLVLTIPYEADWKILVDGEEVVAEAVLEDTFLGITLTEGKHHVELSYESHYNQMGKILSLVGLCLFVLLFVLEKKRKKI